MTDLPQLLDDVADRALLYDVVDHAYAVGRRRRRVRHLLRAMMVAAAVTATVATATVAVGRRSGPPSVVVGSPTPTPTVEPTLAPPTSCVAEPVRLPSGYPANAMITSGDPTGEYLAGRAYPDSARRTVFVYHDGAVSTVDIPGLDASLDDINSSGDGVASSWVGDEQVGWVYAAGQVLPLATGGAAFGRPASINDQGAIVGSLQPQDDYRGVPVIWRSPTAEPEPLPLPPGVTIGTATSIDNDGTIFGAFGDTFTPIAWLPDRTIVRPPVSTPQLEAAMEGGWAAVRGSVDGAPGIYLWNVHTGALVRSPVSGSMMVNANGWTVGHHEGGAMVLAAGDQVIDLDAAPGGPGNGASITYLSDDARLLGGYQTGPEGENLATIWRCR